MIVLIGAYAPRKLLIPLSHVDVCVCVWQGELCCLDVGEKSVLHNTLIMDGLQDVRTILEMDFGRAICDVNYFGCLEDVSREQRLFVCGNYLEEQLEPSTT